MKKIFFVIVICTVFFTFFGLDASAKEVKNMCVYGDSIPEGYGLENQADNFVNILAKEYGLEADKSLFNYSVSGGESFGLIEQLHDTDDGILRNADTVIISIGGNDIMDTYGERLMYFANTYKKDLYRAGIKFQEYNPVSILSQLSTAFFDAKKSEAIMKVFESASDEYTLGYYKKIVSMYEDNVKEAIAYIRDVGSEADIYLFALYDPMSVFPIDMPFFNSLHENIGVMHEYVLNLAEENEKVYAVDVYSHFDGHYLEWTNILKFDIHPNKAGHWQLYSITNNAIKDTANETKESFAESSTDIFESSFEVEIHENKDYIVWIIIGGMVLAAAVGALIIALLKNSDK